MTAAHNSTVHRSSTGLTLNRIFFGRDLKFPTDLVYDTGNHQAFSSTEDYVAMMTERQIQDFKFLREQLDKSATTRKSHYDYKVRPGEKIQVNDLVWYFYKGRSPLKLQLKNVGWSVYGSESN